MKKCTGKGIIQTGFEICSEEKFTWIKRKSALQSAVLRLLRSLQFAPTEAPTATPEPTAEPTATPEPTAAPTPVVTAAPQPVVTAAPQPAQQEPSSDDGGEVPDWVDTSDTPLVSDEEYNEAVSGWEGVIWE